MSATSNDRDSCLEDCTLTLPEGINLEVGNVGIEDIAAQLQQHSSLVFVVRGSAIKIWPTLESLPSGNFTFEGFETHKIIKMDGSEGTAPCWDLIETRPKVSSKPIKLGKGKKRSDKVEVVWSVFTRDAAEKLAERDLPGTMEEAQAFVKAEEEKEKMENLPDVIIEDKEEPALKFREGEK